MSNMQTQPVATTPEQGAGLSQIQRVVNTFTAPSKTFFDIRDHSRSWWLPFLIYVAIGYAFFAVVNNKVGMRQLSQNQIQISPKAQERLANATPEQREAGMKITIAITEGFFIAGPIIVLIVMAVGSLVLWGTINFGFGGKAKYGQIFASWMYAGLPGVIKPLLGIILLMIGTAPDTFNIKNYSPTNPAALFMNPADSIPAIYALASSIDVITIWTVVLIGIGLATVARTKRSSGYITSFGWWALIVLVGAGFAAAFG